MMASEMTDSLSPLDIVSDGGSVYFSLGGPVDQALVGEIRRVPVGTTDMETLVAGVHRPQVLREFGDNLFWYEVEEIRDTGLDTSAGRDVDDVVITLTENVTSIQGNVRGEGAAGAAVIVFPVDRTRWVDYGADPILIKSKAADSNGAFLVKGLAEGDYFAVAVDRSQHDAWTDPKFLDAASAAATRIALKWGDKKPLDLQITKVVVK